MNTENAEVIFRFDVHILRECEKFTIENNFICVYNISNMKLQKRGFL